MNATRLPLLLFALLAVGCSSIGIEGQFLQPEDVTATALTTSIHIAPTSTIDLSATAAVERAVRLTLTAAVPSPTNTPRPSPMAEPTTAIPPTETPLPTATKKPAPQATLTPVGSDPFVGTWVAVDIYDGSNQVLTITRSNGGYNLVLVDDGASVCGLDEAGKPKFAIEIRAVGTAQGNVLTSTSTSAVCLRDPPSSPEVVLAITHTYRASADTLIDSWMRVDTGAVFSGPVWRRR